MLSVWCLVAGIVIAPLINTDYSFGVLNPRPAIALAGFTIWLSVNMLLPNRFDARTRRRGAHLASVGWLVGMFLVMGFFTPSQGPCGCSTTVFGRLTVPETIVMALGIGGFVLMLLFAWLIRVRGGLSSPETDPISRPA